MFKRSKRELKKSFFLLKRIERKKRIRVKRNLLKKRICFVMFKKTNTNFFVTVIDIAGNVIMYSSAGMYCNFNNSKKKNSVFLVNLMMKGVVNKIRSLKIKRLRILLKSNVSKHVFQAVRYLNKFRFEIEHIALLKPIPHHNGQRKRKLKRL
jgi:ribosomal protein S11